MSTENANIIEMFSSVQGEGVYVGCRQAFLRFSGCNLKCSYCDTIFNSDFCALETLPGTGDIEKIKNPISIAQIRAQLDIWFNSCPHHSVSFTGGEPLLHAEFLNELARYIKSRSVKTFLETNGTLPNELNKCIEQIDIISMDLKLPETLPDWNEEIAIAQRKFLQIARNKDLYLKVVVAENNTEEAYSNMVNMIAQVDSSIPLIIQPVTPTSNVKIAPSASKLLHFQQLGLSQLRDVRIIPQTHKQIGLL
ncbi:organic radical activating enzyme [Desulfitispora alkaliphila]|uniref:7-carboxy-7-deazaguanine synthase QueE n=1 Tax=Desulfitispora alkaliphila TaxID=622674 RepID=UPI003D1AAE0C